ncbi:MAG TPA: D-2-hydroxyacid dehydrogenase [Bryobacteraceae bacterium]|nr:D-2-hydroxyacid dehydrogenase [Bryobacteraceae bacterium]
MPKPNVFVVCPPDHPVLKNLDAIREQANISVGGDPAAVARFARDAEIILYSGFSDTVVPFHDVWQAARKVKWVQSLSAGVEKLVTSDLAHSDVPLTNARGVFKRSLAEFAIFGILYHYKRGRRLVESQRVHHWDNFHVGWVPDKVMGIVGYGEIGRECGLLAHGLGMKIQAVRRRPEHSAKDPILDRVFPSEGLHEMLHAIDVLLAAAPLTPQTKHMLGYQEFSAMKPSSIVINVGRGPVIDQEALIRALQEKKIAGAALDVFETEPLPADNPLWDMENVLISPHCTDRTDDPDWLDLSMQVFIKNFGRYVKGEPLINVVDKKAGY